MPLKKVLVCPKCGSREIEWIKGSRGDVRECVACGHTGEFTEEMVDEDESEIWP